MFPDSFCWLPGTWRSPGRRMTTGGVQGECNGRLGSPRLQALTDESAAATGHESRVWICVEVIERNSSAQAAIHSPTLKLTDFSCWKRVAHVDQAMSYRIAPHSRTILAIFWKNSPFPRDAEQIKRSFNTQILWNHHRCSSLLADVFQIQLLCHFPHSNCLKYCH